VFGVLCVKFEALGVVYLTLSNACLYVSSVPVKGRAAGTRRKSVLGVCKRFRSWRVKASRLSRDLTRVSAAHSSGHTVPFSVVW
jgi:hypothetical protein